MNYKIAVIGVGYVGLPLVHAFSENKINAKVACPLFPLSYRYHLTPREFILNIS